MVRKAAPFSAPIRGVPGGFRDWWDAPDEAATLRERAEDERRRLLVAARRECRQWRSELARERKPSRRPSHKTRADQELIR